MAVEDDSLDLEKIFGKYRFAPEPSLDQHFLKDKKIINQILELLNTKEDDTIFEIGAGIGTITKEIPKCKKVYAVELDENAFNILQQEVKHKNHIECINGDAISLIDKLKFSKIISSTPFSICEPLIQKLFTINYEKCVILLPKKFVDNLLQKKTKLGLFVNAFLNINIIAEVPQQAFNPVPRAKTLLLTIEKLEQDKSEKLSQDNLIIRYLYFQRDKKLKNALREILIKLFVLTKKQAKSIILRINISDAVLERNVENLNYQHYLRLVDEIKKIEAMRNKMQ